LASFIAVTSGTGIPVSLPQIDERASGCKCGAVLSEHLHDIGADALEQLILSPDVNDTGILIY
jgi:hypothetical protein